MPDLKTLAYCCQSHQRAVTFAAGVTPYTCPPTCLELFSLGSYLQEHGPFDLLYISLHGYQDLPYWYGDGGHQAVHVHSFQDLDLSHTVVFIASCHFSESPFLPALKACHPRLLVGGPGRNYTRTATLVGANLLGYFLRLNLCSPLNRHNRRAEFAYETACAEVRSRIAKLVWRRTRLKNARHHPLYLRLTEDIIANCDALNFRTFT